jgi:hypothetical protein
VRIVYEDTSARAIGPELLANLPALAAPQLPDFLKPPRDWRAASFDVTFLDRSMRVTVRAGRKLAPRAPARLLTNGRRRAAGRAGWRALGPRAWLKPPVTKHGIMAYRVDGAIAPPPPPQRGDRGELRVYLRDEPLTAAAPEDYVD